MNTTRLLVTSASFIAMSAVAHAQTTTTQADQAPAAQAPAPAAPSAEAPSELPPVVVPQQQPKLSQPAAVAKPKPKSSPASVATPATTPKPKAKPKPVQQAAPAPVPPAPTDFVEDTGPSGPSRAPADGRLETNAAPGSTPVNADSIVPQDLQNYAGAATRVDAKQIAEERPLTTHEALASVPGVVTVTDDGLARNVGIGIRGSNFRRARKVLVMEDGVSINFSSYIDPSTHYTPPMDRVENVEVIRGTVFAHGPLNNHGVVNFQSMSPFGRSETVIKGALIHTGDVNQEWGNYRHVHTRQNLGNFGVVAAYTGGDASGAWDNERLSYNDFYGSIGWKGADQDLTISAVYFRQRDNYDEDNFVGTREDFFANGHNKLTTFGDDTRFNTYNGEHRSITLTHNYYVDDDTTVSTRLYARDHERNRFSARDGGIESPPDGHMRGRNRLYSLVGIDSRLELANRPFLFGMTQDILGGVRYEYQGHRRCTSFGAAGELLDHDNGGNCFASEAAGDLDDGAVDKFEASSLAAFLQSAIHVNKRLTITPGIRFEKYDVERRNIWDGGPVDVTQTSKHDHVLPGMAFAWQAAPAWTLYGGYHRGFAPHIAAEFSGDFPLEEEVGDNFQIGLRSTGLKGFKFDAAYFHSFIDGYQLKESFTNSIGDGVYGLLDKVEINGVEFAVRLDSRPFTGSDWNLFGQAAYTYTNGKIDRGQDAIFEGDGIPFEDVSGNRLPFTIKHFANLTLGVAYRDRWDASLTWTYRGDFFTNPQNTGPLLCVDEDGIEDGDGLAAVSPGCTFGDELIGGKVDDVWLLSARTNLKVTDQLSLFLSGHNLTDELYIAELSDGAKPGQGRTIMGGFTLKFD